MYPPVKITTLMMFSFLLHPTISYSTNDEALNVKILSPQNGQTVSQTFEVNYEIHQWNESRPNRRVPGWNLSRRLHGEAREYPSWET